MGRGALPGCLEGQRHVFAPDSTVCGCGTQTRPPNPLGWITTAPEALSVSLRKEEQS